MVLPGGSQVYDEVTFLSSKALSCMSPPETERGPKCREALTSDFTDGADNHGPVVGGSKQVAVTGALALLRGLHRHCHRGRLRPRATDQVPLQQLSAGQDDPIVGERDAQPGSEKGWT